MATLIFDFDGTLVDSFKLLIAGFNEQARQANFREIRKRDIPILRDLSVNEAIKYLQISLVKLPFIIRKVKASLHNSISLLPPMNTNMIAVLKSLKQDGHNLGILTTNSVANVKAYLQHHKINLFDFIYAESFLFRKARVLKKLLRTHKIDTAQAFYISDEARDIDTANVCHVHSVAVTWGFNSKKLLQKCAPDFIIDQPTELLGIV